MATSNKSTGAEWNDLPLFAEGTPVSLSVQQVIAKVKKILATCGLGYEKPLANYDLTTQSWKMSAGICPLGEQPSLPILPPSGMTRNGALFQQPAWVPLTGETASSLWPTPTASGDTSNINGKFKNPTLGDAVRMWPTPLAQGAGGSGHYNKVEKLYSEGLVTYEEKMALQAGRGGKLNPTWVEWLMGFPTGWTDLED
jgi:DNA (cytosine-5)-methyltransferase 1